MLKATDPTTRKYRIAAYNARLHKRGICPANHNVEYACGWYYVDGEPRQAPDVTRRSQELEDDPNVEVFFQESWNTYVLSPIEHEFGSPVQGTVDV